MTEDELLSIYALNQVCDGKPFDKVTQDLQISRNLSSLEIIERIRRISSDDIEISKMCFASECLNYGYLMSKQGLITEEGFCHSFNMLHSDDIYTKDLSRDLAWPRDVRRSNWTIVGYTDADIDAYPYRSVGRGVDGGVTLRFEMRKDNINYNCKESGDGFRLSLHTSGDTPRPSTLFNIVPFNSKSLVAIRAKVMTTSENLINYKPEKRQCFFEGEKKLRFYKTYTQSNCQIECLSSELIDRSLYLSKTQSFLFTDLTLALCGCVKFAMPHANSTPICKPSNLKCVEKMPFLMISLVSVLLLQQL